MSSERGAVSPADLSPATQARPVVWTIAGSDSGGGAGIQADLHTLHDLGVHGCSVISAITAQNSVAVKMVDPVLMQTFTAQIDALGVDLPPAAIKTGLLGSAGTQADRRAALRAAGFAAADVDRIRGPIGLKGVGALEPAEIAVSILAELVMARRGKLETGGGEGR